MRKKIMASKIASDSKWIYLLLILISLTFLIPLLYIISISFQNDMQVREYGYRLIPKKIDFTAYVYIFHNRQQIMDSYLTTIFYSVTGTFLSVVIMALISYPLSQSNFRFRKPITFIVFFTMLFSGGACTVVYSDYAVPASKQQHLGIYRPRACQCIQHSAFQDIFSGTALRNH
jgi:putative aldouronate transport system permease protein